MTEESLYGAAADFYVELKTAGTQDFRAAPTLAAGDAKVSIDGGAFNNLTALPTVTPAGGKQVKVALSVAELTGKKIKVHLVDQTGPKEWDDFSISISTYGNASAQHQNKGIAMRGTDNAALASVCTETRLSELDAGNIPGDIDTIDSNVDTVKAKTDQLNFIGSDVVATLDGEAIATAPGTSVLLEGDIIEGFPETSY